MTVTERDRLIGILVKVTSPDAQAVAATMSEDFQRALPKDVFDMVVVWYAAVIAEYPEGVLRAIARMPDDVLTGITVMFAPVDTV